MAIRHRSHATRPCSVVLFGRVRCGMLCGRYTRIESASFLGLSARPNDASAMAAVNGALVTFTAARRILEIFH